MTEDADEDMEPVFLPPVIGLAGRKQSGKDTAGAVFASLGFTRLAFATPIKLMLQIFLQYRGVDQETIYRMIEGDLKEVPTPYLGGRSPRYAMQTLGTEWGRNLMDSELWVDALVDASERYDMVVVTDVRNHNEVAAIRDRCEGQVWRITRPDMPANDQHASEAHVDDLDVDQEIVNDASSAEAFQHQLAQFFIDDGKSAETH